MEKFIAASPSWTDPTMLVTIVLLFGLILMMLFSSRRRKSVQSQVEKMLDELRPGQRVRTVGGIIGRIKEIREESPAHTTPKGVRIPAVKTVLIQTGSDKNPAFMLFDIQAIYGVIPEEGHTLEGLPVMKLPDPTIEGKLPAPTSNTAPKSMAADTSDDFNAQEYVGKRNNLSNKDKKKKQ